MWLHYEAPMSRVCGEVSGYFWVFKVLSSSIYLIWFDITYSDGLVSPLWAEHGIHTKLGGIIYAEIGLANFYISPALLNWLHERFYG